jgi:hypothetical protein
MKYIVTTADCTLLHNERINWIVKKPTPLFIIRNSQANWKFQIEIMEWKYHRSCFPDWGRKRLRRP